MDKRRLGWVLALVVYAGLIFAASSMKVDGDQALLRFSGSDKLFHALEFGFFYFLCWKVFRWHRGLIALVLTAIYAGGDELHQIFVATRQASILDWLADIAGAGCAGLGIALVVRYCLPSLVQGRILAADTEDREESE